MKFNSRTLIAASAFALLVGCDSNGSSAFIDPGVAVGGGGGAGGGGGGGGGGTGNEPRVIFSPNQVNGIARVLISGNSNRISFTDDSDPLGTNAAEDWQIWSYDVTQDFPVQLTPDTTTDIFPSTEIDATDNGEFITFITNDDLVGTNPTNRQNVFISAADGSGTTQVTDLSGSSGAREAVISGDGSLIVFESDDDLTGGNPALVGQIFTIDSVGTNLTQITNQSLVPQHITISDDGTMIAFTGSGDPFGSNPSGREIFTVNVDGSNLTQLTMGLEQSWGPRLSDDGSLVVFTSDGDHVPGSNADASVEVFVGRTNGGGFTQISDGTVNSGAACCTRPRLSISGDGLYVAFNSTADFTGRNPGLNSTIFWANSSGGAVTQLLRPGIVPDSVTNFSASEPSLNNNGSTIAFVSSRNFTATTQDGNDKIYTAVRQ